MKQLVTLLLIALGLGVFALFMVPSAHVSAGPGPAPVTVENTPLPVSSADNPAKQPFVASCVIIAASPCEFSPSVPSGKRLVIEVFTESVSMVVGKRPYGVELAGTANGSGYGLAYPLSFTGTSTGSSADLWDVSQPLTRAYADPGTTEECRIFFNVGEFNEAGCTLSGYLINVP